VEEVTTKGDKVKMAIGSLSMNDSSESNMVAEDQVRAVLTAKHIS